MDTIHFGLGVLGHITRGAICYSSPSVLCMSHDKFNQDFS